MLIHANSSPVKPARVAVLGAGFIGAAAADAMTAAGADVLRLGRCEIDLLGPDAAARLAAILRPDDGLVVVAAEAPCKSSAMLARNIQMMAAICDALAHRSCQYVLYVSSDAVYADEPLPLTEMSSAAPGSLHGIMHLAREAMLRDVVKGPLGVVRPTLVYGAADPHNGYGPNRFLRLALAQKPIVLFGNGEEQRDHVYVDDIADLIKRMVWLRSDGVLNGATGETFSFRTIAETAVALAGAVPVQTTPRSGPMPHNGFRPFDPAATKAAFPDFSFTPFAAGFAAMHRQLANG